jgi:ABC-2 type transport system permease protein
MLTTTSRPRALLASEWTKLVTVRSTYLTMLIALLISVAGGIVSASGRAHEWATMTGAQRADFDPVNLSYDGLAFAQLAFGVLGVLAISSEYATGMIRTTFTSTPRRQRVLAAKAALLGVLTLALGEAFSFTTFLLAQLALRGKHLDVALGDPHVLRAVICAGLYLCALALIGLGLGTVVRHSAGAITGVFTLVFIIPILAPAVAAWTTVPEKWNLWAAGNSLISTHPTAVDQPSTGLAAIVCATYVAAALGTAVALINRRDV